jgi:hypothetical protein
VPYADPEKRRAYNREYGRRRGLWGLTIQAGQPVSKCYVNIGPSILIPVNGPGQTRPLLFHGQGRLYITGSPGEQQAIEGCKAYGEHIFSWIVRP